MTRQNQPHSTPTSGPIRAAKSGTRDNPDNSLVNQELSVPDIHAELVRATSSLTHSGGGTRGAGITSDLSIDESLLIHSQGWEPIDLVVGVSLYSIPVGIWQWGQGEIAVVSHAQTSAVSKAIDRLLHECMRVGGHGVVGVKVEFKVERHHVDIELLGTAVRPIGGSKPSVRDVFVSDLSGRDFTLLLAAGWKPLGLAFGTSFVYVPRRSASAALQQKTQNIELTNFTEAMYSARESGMERLQSSALTLGATGVVQVNVSEGPMLFARHAIGFTCWGTAVKLNKGGHQYLQPQVVLEMDDSTILFAAESLK